jgi:hypothetical protein
MANFKDVFQIPIFHGQFQICFMDKMGSGWVSPLDPRLMMIKLGNKSYHKALKFLVIC